MKTLKSIHDKLEANIVKNWRFFFALFLATLFLAVSFLASAQNNKLETDKGLIESVAPFDASTRRAMLQASEYPQVLTRVQNAQAQTASSFQKIISRFRKKKQEWYYTITRYPDLMHQLAKLPSKQSEDAVYKLLPGQDPDLKETAWRLYKSDKKNLVKLDNIRLSANSEFEKMVASLNPSAREAFHQLQTKPDALVLLTNNIGLTTRLGDRYRSNPAGVTSELAALHDKLEIQNQREAAAFKKQMENDPLAMKELRQASNAYSGAPNYNNNPYYYPYSYWFGYPYWYSYPMWYPGAFWYYPGFYFGAGGLYGFPSYGFSFWFYNGGYYARYPHLYRQFGVYYRSNLMTNRGMTPVNRGFRDVAGAHYGFNGGSLNSTSPYSMRQVGQPRLNRGNYTNHFNANTYHAQSWGGSRGGSFGGGFHAGGGMHVGRH